jgi:hypothetical protein
MKGSHLADRFIFRLRNDAAARFEASPLDLVMVEAGEVECRDRILSRAAKSIALVIFIRAWAEYS